MTARRLWMPCRVCGATHQNPMSSSICQPCGAAEREAGVAARRAEQAAFEQSRFGQFMELSEEERWRRIFEVVTMVEERG